MIPFDNVILTDIDGCVLYYEHSFHMWMCENGYLDYQPGVYYMHEKYKISEEKSEYLVRSFNESAMLTRLPPVKDAIKYIRKLHEEFGYVFHAITSVPNNIDVYNARSKNLENLFGKTAFEKLILCEHSSEKKKYLKNYEGTECFWIEDLMKNATMGLEFGLKPLLMDRHYNRMHNHDHVARVYNWKEIYKIVTGEMS